MMHLHTSVDISKLNKMLFGYFDPEIIFKIMKVLVFMVTDISARKKIKIKNIEIEIYTKVLDTDVDNGQGF